MDAEVKLDTPPLTWPPISEDGKARALRIAMDSFEPAPEIRPRPAPVTLKRAGALTVWQEAREQIDAWEKAYPLAAHVVLVLDGPEEVILTCAGDAMKPSTAAGLLFTAAQGVVS